jgi:hypothetical protein
LIPRGDTGLVILASWQLPREKFKAAKRSRMIRIAIAHEALEGYAAADPSHRTSNDARFVSWFKSKLSEFDPQHDSPLGVEPTPVTWALDTRELNGATDDDVLGTSAALALIAKAPR